MPYSLVNKYQCLEETFTFSFMGELKSHIPSDKNLHKMVGNLQYNGNCMQQNRKNQIFNKWTYSSAEIPVYAGSIVKIRSWVFCIKTFITLILILQNWKQMNTFQNTMEPFQGKYSFSSQYTDNYYHQLMCSDRYIDNISTVNLNTSEFRGMLNWNLHTSPVIIKCYHETHWAESLIMSKIHTTRK